MRHIVVGTAGHIDHGKSSLVKALTGTDPDRLKEEKARGITTDLGFAHWDGPDVSISFVDAPGHERFVKNMLAGAGGIDAVLLVVAADESVMPQTREHFEICRLLRVPAGVVALTKADAADAEMIALVRAEVEELVRGSFLDGAPVVPVSARSGAGLGALRGHLAALADAAAERPADGPARLPIDRVFTMKGFGTVVTGTLASGTLAVEASAAVLPGGRVVKIRGLQVHGGRTAQSVAGQRVAANLGGIETADLARGQALVSPGGFDATRAIDARIEVLRGARPLKHGARVRVHHGTAEAIGRVALSSVLAQDGREAGQVMGEIPPGRSAYVRLRLEAPIVATRGDRMVIRAYSPPVTVGGGVVLDPAPPKGGIRTAAGRARYVALDPGDEGVIADSAARAVLRFADEAGAAGVPVAALASRAGLLRRDDRRPIDDLLRTGRLVQVGPALVGSTHLARLAEEILELAGRYHREHPLEEGMPREEARERVCGRAAAGVFERALEGLVQTGRIAVTDRIALTTHRVEAGSAEAAARDAIEARFREAGLRPPDQAALAAELGRPPSAVAAVVALLVRQRVLTRVDTLVFHETALARLKEDLRGLKAGSAGAAVPIDVAAFKARYGLTRKYAIPLLEYLDRERVTRRTGEGRVLT
ncbi:MAG TPA: selenocysteine-specific translation elongation factor [Vicinamibacterales bacterium]|nr:selenocysteine-specific translation elongation factor [Vicinamibacterales bacterium]